MKKPIDKKSKPKPSTTTVTSRDLRNLKAFELSATGATQSEIGEEIGLSRQQVNGILNSDQAKEFVHRAKSRLLELQDEAVLTLESAMADRDKDMKTAVQAATTILKGLGVLKDNIQIDDSKPFIIQFSDGSLVKMGHGPKKDS